MELNHITSQKNVEPAGAFETNIEPATKAAAPVETNFE